MEQLESRGITKQSLYFFALVLRIRSHTEINHRILDGFRRIFTFPPCALQKCHTEITEMFDSAHLA